MVYSKKIKDGGKVDKLVKPINLKAFYNEMHDWLVSKGFKDMLNDPDNSLKYETFEGLDNQTKAGEFTDNKANLNRTGDMFEIKFYQMKKEGVTELEIAWKAKRKAEHSINGWFEFKLDLVVRNLKDVEIVDGAKKTNLQSGAWEFRNELVYYNNFKEAKIMKMPIIKNFHFLQELFFEKFHGPLIEADEKFGEEKLLEGIYSVINKHFT